MAKSVPRPMKLILKPEQRQAIEEFRNKILPHEYYSEAKTDLINAILAGTKPILLLVAPTGAGKTKLCAKVIEELVKYSTTDPSFHPGRIAAISAEISGKAPLNVNHLFNNLLEQGREPLIDHKIHYSIEHVVSKGPPVQEYWQRKLEKLPPEDAYIKMLEHRQPYAVFFDESPNLLNARQYKDYLTQLDMVKSLANRSTVTHVLVGTHKVLNLIGEVEVSAQLDRRTDVVPLYRYHNSGEEIGNFQLFVRSIQADPLIKADFSMEDNIDTIFRYTNGLVGMFKDWVADALTRAYQNGRTGLTWDDMKATTYTDDRLKSMLADIVEGERRLARFCRLPEAQKPANSAPNNTKEDDKPSTANTDKADTSQGKRKRHYPGQQNPRRYPIGLPDTKPPSQ